MSDQPQDSTSVRPVCGTASLAERLRVSARNDIRRLLNTGVVHVLVVLAGTRAMAIIQQLVLVRLVSQEEIGGIIFAMRIVQLIAVGASLGMITAVLKFCSEPVAEEQIRRRYRTALTSAFAASLLIAAVYAVLVPVTNSFGGGAALVGPMLVLAVFLAVNPAKNVAPAYLQARKRIKTASKITFVIQGCTLAVTVSTVALIGVWGYYIAVTLGAVVGVGIFLYVTRDGWRQVQADWSEAGPMIHMGMFSLLANFTGVANATLSVVLLKWLSGSMTEVAVFGIASYVMLLVRLLPQSLRLTSLPYLSALLKDRLRMRARVRELIRKHMPVMLAAVVFIGVAGYWLLPLVLGENYADCYWPMMVLLGGTLAWSLVFPYGLVMIICNRVRVNFLISVLQLGVSVALAIVLIPRFGAVGSAMAMALSTVAVVLPKWYFGTRALAQLPLASDAPAEPTSETATNEVDMT